MSYRCFYQPLSGQVYARFFARRLRNPSIRMAVLDLTLENVPFSKPSQTSYYHEKSTLDWRSGSHSAAQRL